MAAISQMTLSSAFSWTKVLKLWLKFHWSLFLRGPINDIPVLFQIMAWRRPGAKPLSEPMVIRSPTQIFLTRPQWVNKYLVRMCCWILNPISFYSLATGKKWIDSLATEKMNIFFSSSIMYDKSCTVRQQVICWSIVYPDLWHYINGLVQDCSNSIAIMLELLQSCTKRSIWHC